MTTVPALWTKNRGLAISIAQDYFLPGHGRDDVVQEALIGLWIAARTYDPEKASFATFARVVIERRLKECLQRANALKHQILTGAARDVSERCGSDLTVDEVLGRERFRAVVATIRGLTSIEQEAVRARLDGSWSAADKRLDNGLERARAKLRRAA